MYTFDTLPKHKPCMNMKQTVNGIEFVRVNNDKYGNPRYVAHYLNFLNEKDKEGVKVWHHYDIALDKSRKIGGKNTLVKTMGEGLYLIPEILKDFQPK